MYSILIKFPFSSVNDEQYELALYSSRTTSFQAAIDAMTADSRCFQLISTQTIDGNTIRTFEGTLVGQVTTEDDEREDVFVPLVASKLKFNMACQTFPTWLMDICDYYTNVKAVLSVKHGGLTIERWRGYLMANTLNMTVVNDMLACPLVAVDEVGMSKYLKFKENYDSMNASPTLFDLFGEYWSMNATDQFADLYTMLGITMRNSMIVSRNMRYKDSSDNEVYDLMDLTVNLERWFIDREATWENVISDVCSYLGFTFCVGAKDSSGCDCYILAGTDYAYSEYLAYTFGTSGYSRQLSRPFADFGNQSKVGADFQATYKPCEWKGVKVKSTPERPPVHEYLSKDNVKAIEPAAGHAEWCETRVGQEREQPANTLENYYYRVFQYAEIVDKEDQWIPENKYVTMETCHSASDARNVGIANGYFPLTDSALGHLTPLGSDTDSMDFALAKWGMIVARLGNYDTLREKVSADLKNYFVILNNKWGRLYWDDDALVAPPPEPTPEVIATFTPFADDASVRPNAESWLSIDFSAMILNENIGDCRIVKNGVMDNDLLGEIQAVFPILDSMYDWAAGDTARYTGNLTGTSSNYLYSFYPYLIARISIGNHYWNGTTWEYRADANNLPTFNLPLIPSDFDRWWVPSTGYLHGSVRNYYYVECRPKLGASDNVFRLPLDGLSLHGQPLDGKVKLEIFGRVPFFNAFVDQHGVRHDNNILFVLLSDVKIGFTDQAYYADKEIDTIAQKDIDATSTTKKTMEVALNLSTPTVDGVFNNCLLYDDGTDWINLKAVHRSGKADTTPEKIKADEMAAVMCYEQLFVEFSRNFDGYNTDNIYNVGFTVTGLTEASGKFMPLNRKFDWTRGTVKWNMQKVG